MQDDQDHAEAPEKDDKIEKVEKVEKVEQAETDEDRLSRHYADMRKLTDELLMAVKAVPAIPAHVTDPKQLAALENERRAAILVLHQNYAKDARALVERHRAETVNKAAH